MIRILVLLLLLPTISYSQDNVKNLKLVKALPITGPYNNEPSGLTVYNNRLFTVSDNHDDYIYELIIRKNTALQKPFLKLNITSLAGVNGRLDYEGIAVDKNGYFYITSETHFRIFRVTDNGKRLKWIVPSLKDHGRNYGLFKKSNANLEGLTFYKNKIITCSERESRGIIIIDINSAGTKIIKKDNSVFSRQTRGELDFTGLFSYKDNLYVLQRNSYLLCKLIFKGDKIIEKDGYSYKKVVTDKKYRYENMQYGRAEGLAMDNRYIYIILDNNGDLRESEINDNRPLLLIFKNPFN